jgi:hypothetical protein
MRLSSLLLLLLPVVEAGCKQCVNDGSVWCFLDEECHAVGSWVDPCDDATCISTSFFSSCELTKCPTPRSPTPRPTRPPVPYPTHSPTPPPPPTPYPTPPPPPTPNFPNKPWYGDPCGAAACVGATAAPTPPTPTTEFEWYFTNTGGAARSVPGTWCGLQCKTLFDCPPAPDQATAVPQCYNNQCCILTCVPGQAGCPSGASCSLITGYSTGICNYDDCPAPTPAPADDDGAPTPAVSAAAGGGIGGGAVFLILSALVLLFYRNRKKLRTLAMDMRALGERKLEVQRERREWARAALAEQLRAEQTQQLLHAKVERGLRDGMRISKLQGGAAAKVCKLQLVHADTPGASVACDAELLSLRQLEGVQLGREGGSGGAAERGGVLLSLAFAGGKELRLLLPTEAERDELRSTLLTLKIAATAAHQQEQRDTEREQERQQEVREQELRAQREEQRRRRQAQENEKQERLLQQHKEETGGVRPREQGALEEALREKKRQAALEVEKLQAQAPRPVQDACDRKWVSDAPTARVIADWLVEAHATAHHDPSQKRLARLVLSNPDFTVQMKKHGVWDHPYKDGLRKKLAVLGQPLAEECSRKQLRGKLGGLSVPGARADTSDLHEFVARDFRAKTDRGIQPELRSDIEGIVPSSGGWWGADASPEVRQKHERVFIHILVMIAKALNEKYHEMVRKVLAPYVVEGAGVMEKDKKGHPRICPEKGVARMECKRVTDHSLKTGCRPAFNIDVLRIIGVCETPEQLKAAIKALLAAFGGCGRIKSGFDLDDEKAAKSFNLRVVLGNFVVGFDMTYGELAQRAGVAAMWEKHVRSPPQGGASRGRWREEAEEARVFLTGAEVSRQDVYFICEAQMMLQSTYAVRANMHELYKGFRADAPQLLYEDMLSEKLKAKLEKEDVDDHASKLTSACRDGDPGTVAALLRSTSDETRGDAFVVACARGREDLLLVGGALSAPFPARVAADVWDEAWERAADAGAAQDIGAHVIDALLKLVATALAQKKQLPGGFGVNREDGNGWTALQRASIGGHHTAAAKLLAAGAATDQAHKPNGSTPLCMAAESGHTEVVRLLLEEGADVNRQNKKGQKPLDLAAACGHNGVVELLLPMARKVQGFGDTALRRAASNGHEPVVKQLLFAGVAAQQFDPLSGRSPLNFAAENGHKPVADWLIRRGALPDSDPQAKKMAMEKYNQEKGDGFEGIFHLFNPGFEQQQQQQQNRVERKINGTDYSPGLVANPMFTPQPGDLRAGSTLEVRALEMRQIPASLVGHSINVEGRGVGTVVGVKKAIGKSTQHLVSFHSNPTAGPQPVLLRKGKKGGKGLSFRVVASSGAAGAAPATAPASSIASASHATMRTSNVNKYAVGQHVHNMGAYAVSGRVLSVAPDVGTSGPGMLTIQPEDDASEFTRAFPVLQAAPAVDNTGLCIVSTSNVGKYAVGQYVENIGASRVSGHIVDLQPSAGSGAEGPGRMTIKPVTK